MSLPIFKFMEVPVNHIWIRSETPKFLSIPSRIAPKLARIRLAQISYGKFDILDL